MVIPLRFGAKCQQLKAAALAKRIQLLIDLETWRLPFLDNDQDKSFGSDVETAIAQVVPLPLTSEKLRDDPALQPLVRAAITAQVGAADTFAPDFQIESLDSEWLEVNLRSLRMTRALAGGREVSAWIHTTLEAVGAGILPHLAEIYARELPAGSTVVLTVSELRTDEIPSRLVASYLSGVHAFRSHGLSVVVDRASELSIPAAAVGAAGCLLGTRAYRVAASSPRPQKHFSSPRLKYFVGSQARLVKRDDARKRFAKGKLPPCANPHCQAIQAGESEPVKVRLHNAHEQRDAVRRASECGLSALIDEWKDAPLKHLREWAEALQEFNSMRKEA